MVTTMFAAVLVTVFRLPYGYSPVQSSRVKSRLDLCVNNSLVVFLRFFTAIFFVVKALKASLEKA